MFSLVTVNSLAILFFSEDFWLGEGESTESIFISGTGAGEGALGDTPPKNGRRESETKLKKK